MELSLILIFPQKIFNFTLMLTQLTQLIPVIYE